MTRQLAIAVIHGMGRQTKRDPDDTAERRYSARFYSRLRANIGADRFDAAIAWREVFWADIVQARQDAFEAAMRAEMAPGFFRSYAMHRLADAATYFPPVRREGSVYEAVHRRIDTTLAHLEQDVAPGAALLVVAHSLGSHMMSCYMWDVVHGLRDRPTRFQRFGTLAGFLTFGCNIPIFTFAYDRVDAVRFPGDPARRAMPWWRNYYAAEDPLGYPLGVLGGGYGALAEAGELADYRMRVGWPVVQRWNPWCHNGYWHDRGFGRRAAAFIEEILALPRPVADIRGGTPGQVPRRSGVTDRL